MTLLGCIKTRAVQAQNVSLLLLSSHLPAYPVSLYTSLTMRVLSFIPALLLAATSFVAASPVGVSTGGNGVSLGASTRSVDTTSDVPALQPYELPLTNATKYLEPLNDQLSMFIVPIS